MNRFKNYLAGAALIAVVGTFVSSRQATAQGGPNGQGNPVPGSAPVNIVSPLPLPVTGNVDLASGASVNIANPATSPVPVQLGISTRYNRLLLDPSGLDEVVPPIPDGQIFIATYVNVVGRSNNSAVPLTDGFCELLLRTGSSTSRFGSMPILVNRGSVAGSEAAFLPLKAGESLVVQCDSTPSNSLFSAVVGGYFVPAP